MSKLLRFFLVFLFLALFLYPPAHAQRGQPLVTLTDAQGEYPLGLHLEILEDPSGELTIEDVTSPEYKAQFSPSQEKVPNFGYTDSAYWVRFRLHNDSDLTDWRLELGFANLQRLEFYSPLTSGQSGFAVKRTGTLYPFNTRDEAYHHFVFKLQLPPQTEETYYLRVQNEASMTLPLTLWSLDAFAQESRSVLFLDGIFYGILLIMVGYNAFLFLSLRDKNYLYYLLFITAFLLFQASFAGHALQYLWPNLAGWNRFAVLFFGAASILAALIFTASFLKLKVAAPELNRVWPVVQTVWGVLLILTPFVRYGLIVRSLVILVIITLVLMFGSGLVVWRRGYSPARLYVLSWTIPVLNMSALILVRFGLLPSTALTDQSFPVGITLMVLLLSLALADRINLFKSEAEQANRELQASEHRINQFLDALPVGVIILNTAQKLHYVNQWITQSFARLGERVVWDRNWDDFLAERPVLYQAGSQQPYSAERRPLARALQGESVATDDMEVVRNGQRIPLEVWSRPIFDEQGRVQYAIAVLQDITEHKQAEAELQRYKERLEEQVVIRTAELSAANEQLQQEILERERIEGTLRLTQFALDNASYPIFWVGRDAEFLYVNQAACELLGYSTEVLLTMHFYDIDANYPPEIWTSHWQSSQARPTSVESHFCTKDSQKIPVSLTFTYFEFAGREYNFVFAQDISIRLWAAQALRDSEELLRQVFSSISDHIYVTEFTSAGQRNNIYMSPTETLTGYPADKFLEDWNFWPSTLIHSDDRGRAADQAQRLAEGQNSEVEYRLIRADNGVIWVRDSGRVEKDPAGEKITVYGVVSDITERKQAAETEAQHARLNAFSAEVGLALTQGDELPVMLQACAQAMVNHLEVALARIWIFNEPENLLELQASAGLYTHLDGGHSRISVTEQKICLAFTVGEPFITNSVGDDPRVDQKDWLEQEDIVSLISYPLVVERQLMGVIAMFGGQPFDQNVVEAMKVMANTIALSIDRKRAEQRLHFQKTLLESQMEAALDGILVVDSDRQQWLSVNQKFIEMWGISDDIYRNKSSEKAFRSMLEQLVKPQEFIDIIDILYEDKEARGHDEILLKDGRIFDRYTGPVKSADGVYYGRVWFYRDITVRKQVEQEIARLFKKQKRTEKSLRRVNLQIEQRIEELAALNYMTQTVATVTDLQTLLEMITQAITNLFNAFSTGISLFNEARTERTIVAMHQVRDGGKLNLVGQIRSLDTDQTYLNYISRGSSVIISTPQNNPLITASRSAAIERNLQCLMLIPLRTRGEVIGTISISTDQPGREFTPDEMKLAETVSGQLAGAVENARLFSAMQEEIVERKHAESALQYANTELQQYIYELATLNQIAQTLASTLDLQSILDGVARTIAELFDASSVSISVYDQARQERTIMAVYDPQQSSRPLPFGQALPVSSDWTDTTIMDSKQSQVIVQPHTSPLFTPEAQGFFRVRQVTCLMLLPMLVRSESMGLLGISTTQTKRQFTPAEVNLGETIAGQIASTIENAQLYRAAEQEIAQRKQAQEALAVARDQALEASRFKTQLLAKVSHEYRTPLGVILGFTEMLRDGIYGDISEQQEKATAQILESSRYLTALVNELLDEAQLETGKLHLKISNFSPAELVSQVETSMRLLAQNNGLELTTNIDPNIPTTVFGDPDRIQQVLVNLVSNAIKFTEQGSVEMRIYCSNSTYWTIQVSDTGPGISAEIQAVIFEPFHQADGSITRKHRGYGLGLSIVKQLTELMEGKVRVESEIGKGSIFTVELPLKIQGLET